MTLPVSSWVSGLAVADVAEARRGPVVLDDEGAAVVEDHDPGGFVEHEHVGPAECVADVEDAATGLD